MVKILNHSGKTKGSQELHAKRIRGSLMLVNHSLTSWAKEQGVSVALVSRLIAGGRPGKRGRSKELREKLLRLQRRK